MEELKAAAGVGEGESTMEDEEEEQEQEQEQLDISECAFNALISIQDANFSIARCIDLDVLPTNLAELRRVRSAALALVEQADSAIESAQNRLLSELRRELEQSQAESSKHASLLHQAKSESSKVGFVHQMAHTVHKRKLAALQTEKEDLTLSCAMEREALLGQQRALQKQLDEEREKSICLVCHENARDTVIIPCLHFQYCFSCLLRHRDANSNTCPTCRGNIQGLCMSSFLAAQ